MNDYDYSNTGLALTRGFEGLRLEAYQDSAGVWTIGYGHTGPEVRTGLRITESEAVGLLREDIASAVRCVRAAVKVPISQGQFDALVDFCFNAGCGSLLGSTLLHLVNRGEFASAAGQFGLWVHAGGEVIPGLVRRRAAEAALFSGQSNPHPSTDVGVAEPGSALAQSKGVTVL
jgi:lysozyme